MMAIKPVDSRRMRDNFSNHAGDYDRFASVQKRVVEILCGRLSVLPVQNGLVLDVGTGTGALAAALLDVEARQPLVVMDIAHGMTRQAATRLPTVLSCDGDAMHLPFAPGSFGGVVSSSVYQWVACLHTAFAEVARVLSPGGVFGLALFGEQTLHELRACHRRAVAASGVQRPSHVQNFPTLDEVGTAITSAGLSCRGLLSTMEVEYHADVPDLLRQLKQIGASNVAADRPRGLAPRRVMQTMMQDYETLHRCAAGLPASYEVIVAIAEKT